MTLIPVWRANIPGTDPIAIQTLYADEQNVGVYRAMERTTVNGVPVATNWSAPLWRLFMDINHRPSLIWQMAVLSVGGADGLPNPDRFYQGQNIGGLDLMGGELSVRIAFDAGRKFYLAQKMQMLLLHQAVDEEGFFGGPTTYVSVFVPRGRPTLDQALGAIPVKDRDASGYVINPTGQFVDYVFKFDIAEMHSVGATPDRVFEGLYGSVGESSEVRERMFARTRLANTMIVFHCPDDGSISQVVPPAFQPPDNWNTPGTPGLWYIAEMELRVNPLRNQNAVAI